MQKTWICGGHRHIDFRGHPPQIVRVVSGRNILIERVAVVQVVRAIYFGLNANERGADLDEEGITIYFRI